MKRILSLLLAALLLCLCGCSGRAETADIAATTLPVYDFTLALCRGTPLTVTQLVTEEVSCLHDYSLNVQQVKAAEAAEVIVLSGAGLEEFLEDLLTGREIIDASHGIELLAPQEHDHGREEEDHSGHHHEADPHIWLDPANAQIMARNICRELTLRYPQWEAVFSANLEELIRQLEDLQRYGMETLENLSCREMITFHDGFAYFAHAFGLTILEAVEEESGSEASAKELIQLVEEVRYHRLPAIFTETNGSVSAADILCRETGVSSFCLDMAMSGDSYLDAMYANIDTIKEALQ